MFKATVLLFLIATSCAGSAQAQTSPNTPTTDASMAQKPITLKLGAFFPSSGNVKDLAGSTLLSAGAEYAFVKKDSVAPVVPLIYVDYAGRSKKRSASDDLGNSVSVDATVSTVGIGGGVRYNFSSSGTSTVTPYVGAGVGVYFDHAKLALSINSDGQTGSGSASNNKTQLGFRLNAGVEFNKTYLLEASNTNAGKIEDTRIDGFGIQAGVRF